MKAILAALGCFASTLYWGVVGVLMLGAIMGDCFPSVGHSCPTDGERNLQAAKTFLVGLALYVVPVAFLWFAFAGTNEDSD
jgi:hypothetical protein